MVLFWMGTAVPMPAVLHLLWWEAPRPVLLQVARALMYLSFSAKAPGDVTHSSLPGKRNNTRESGKINFCSQGEMPGASQSCSSQTTNQAGWFNFCKVKASCFAWDVLQISSTPLVLGLSAAARKKEKKERGTLYRTALYLYLRNNNN